MLEQTIKCSHNIWILLTCIYYLLNDKYGFNAYALGVKVRTSTEWNFHAYGL